MFFLFTNAKGFVKRFKHAY